MFILSQCNLCGIAFHEVDPVASPPPGFTGKLIKPRSEICIHCVVEMKENKPLEYLAIILAREAVYFCNLNRSIAAG